LFLSRSPAFASVCTLVSTLLAYTLNIHCKGLSFNQQAITALRAVMAWCRSTPLCV